MHVCNQVNPYSFVLLFDILKTIWKLRLSSLFFHQNIVCTGKLKNEVKIRNKVPIYMLLFPFYSISVTMHGIKICKGHRFDFNGSIRHIFSLAAVWIYRTQSSSTTNISDIRNNFILQSWSWDYNLNIWQSSWFGIYIIKFSIQNPL